MKLSGIKKSYGDNVVFDGFDIEFQEGKITALLGKSGCGKTTLLNIISGLIDYEGYADSPEKIGYVFQSFRLIPNLTVYENLEYVLHDISDKKKREGLISETLKMVELYEDRNKYPSELSGGMSQRVSLARGFVYPAPLILMDEPFKGLDVSLKKRILSLFCKLYERDNRTVVFVTHDIDEALLLADRIIVFDKGGLVLSDDSIVKARSERLVGDFAELKNKIYTLL